MEILKFDQAPNQRRSKKRSGNVKALTSLATVAAIAVLGSTLAANISLGSSGIEFGQGVQTTAACDSAITVTPTSRFINAAGAGTFYLSTIALTNIDGQSSACQGKTFTVNAYNNTDATPLQIATSGSDAVTSATFVINGASAATIGTGYTATVSGGTGANASVTLGLTTPSATSGAVYKITLQSS